MGQHNIGWTLCAAGFESVTNGTIVSLYAYAGREDASNLQEIK